MTGLGGPHHHSASSRRSSRSNSSNSSLSFSDCSSSTTVSGYSQQQQQPAMTSAADTLTLYVRAGCDNKKYGACPFCQRIFMVLVIKAQRGQLKFKVATVPKTGFPDEFKEHGIRNLPAVIHRSEAIDTVEEIIDYIEAEFPKPALPADDPVAEKVTRNFFSRFCYYIKAVTKDSSSLDSELRRLDSYLRQVGSQQDGGQQQVYLGGEHPSHLDCEIMPKLHHLRVAGQRLKRYEIPSCYTGIWRYLHSAYSCDAFVRSCPPDQEIVLHWADRPDTRCDPGFTGEARAALTRGRGAAPRFSFDVPAVATPVKIS